MPEPVEITVSQQFGAPPDRVYDSWFDRANLGAWMFGATMQDEILRVHIDARLGGRFSFLVRRDGKEIDHVGKYLEMKRPHRLAFTWGIAGMGASSHVAIDIKPDGPGSSVTLTAEIPPEWADYAERTRMGWAKILAAQAAALT